MGLSGGTGAALCEVAFVGAGYMAAEHMRAFAALDDARVAGIYSRTRERAQRLAADHPGTRVCDSIDALWHETHADVVVVTVSELSMRAVAAACFAHPWLVLLEKPVGYDLNEAGAILNAAHEAGSRAYVALNRRAYSSTRIALDRVERSSGQRFIKIQDQQDQIVAARVHKFPPEVVGNYMFVNSIHVIDYLRVFGRGNIVAVEPVVEWSASRPGVVIAKIEFSSGDLGLYEGIWDGPGPWAVTVNTPQERLEMRPLEQISIQLRGERSLVPQAVEAADSQFKPGLLYQAAQSVKASRGEETSLPTLDDAWETMKLVGQIFGLR